MICRPRLAWPRSLPVAARLLLLTGLSPLNAETDYRQFKSSQGSALEARVTKLSLQQVTLTTREGRDVQIAWSVLAQADHDYLRKRYQSENPVGLIKIGNGQLLFTGSSFLEILFKEAGWTLESPAQEIGANPFENELKKLNPNTLKGLTPGSQLRFVLAEVATPQLGQANDLKTCAEWVEGIQNTAEKEGFRTLLVDSFFRDGEDYYDSEGKVIEASQAERNQRKLRSKLTDIAVLPVREVLAALKKESDGKWTTDNLISAEVLGAGVVFAALTNEAPPLGIFDKKKNIHPFALQEGAVTALSADELRPLAQRLLELTRQHMAAR